MRFSKIKDSFINRNQCAVKLARSLSKHFNVLKALVDSPTEHGTEHLSVIKIAHKIGENMRNVSYGDDNFVAACTVYIHLAGLTKDPLFLSGLMSVML